MQAGIKPGKNKNQMLIISKVEKINCGNFKQKNTTKAIPQQILTPCKAWINLSNIVLHKISQREKSKYCMSPLTLKVLKQTKLTHPVTSQANSYLCMESGGGNCSSEMFIVVISLVWVIVTQIHLLCINCSDYSLLICVLFYMHIILQKYLLKVVPVFQVGGSS